MQKTAIQKKGMSIIAITPAACLVLLSGCGPREETAPVQVIEKTTIEKAPKEKTKTVIVQPAPKAAPKTKTETNVTVEVKPAAKSAPAQTLPEPAPVPSSTPKSTQIPPPSTPAAKQESASKPKPKTVPAPKSESSAKPAATKKSETKVLPSSTLKVRAEVIATSKVPDPKSVPYKDALVFTKYKVLEVENGEYKEKEILVAQWAMKNKKLQTAARQKVGEVQTLTLQPLAKRGDLESVMRNDDTGEYDLEPYFAD